MKNIPLVANPLLRLVAERCIDRRSSGVSPVFTLLLSNSSNFIAELPFVYLPDGLMEIHAAGAMAARQVKGMPTLIQLSPVTMIRLAPGAGMVVCNGLFAPGQPNGGRFVYISGAANMPLRKAIARLEPAPIPSGRAGMAQPAFIK
jgi:hypothetical protein